MNILKNFSVPNLCDAGAKPLNGIKPILENQKLVFGEAITVKISYNDWGTLIKTISFAKINLSLLRLLAKENMRQQYGEA